MYTCNLINLELVELCASRLLGNFHGNKALRNAFLYQLDFILQALKNKTGSKLVVVNNHHWLL